MLKEPVELFDIGIHPLTMQEAVDTIYDWVAEKNGCRYVVTPNMDSIVLLSEHKDLARAYHKASLVLVDGNPLVWASKLLGKPLPERVAGSDLVPAIFKKSYEKGNISVFLLGAAPGVVQRAAANIQKQWHHVKVCGSYSPPMGFEYDSEECERIITIISAACPDILVLGLGAPKQELWIEKYAERINARVVLCVGATIDFLAGEKKRAPLWMRKFCLEWLFRMLSEPRRLFPRYLRDAFVFPQIVFAERKKII